MGLIVLVSCRPRTDAPVPVVDLLHDLDRAEKQPREGFALSAHQRGGIVRPAAVVPVPSRLTIPLPLPRRGALQAFVAIEADDPAAVIRFRVGVSDHRIYEALGDIVVSGDRRGWQELRTDLSAYAGFKWSLFYRPDWIVWRLVLATDLLGGRPARAVWGTPEIVTDRDAVKEYVARRERMRHLPSLR